MEWTECPHEIRELRYREYSNGSRAFVRQCMTCGHCTNAIKKLDLPAAERDAAQLVDETLHELHWKTLCEERQRARELDADAKRQEFFKRHEDYLQSSQWRIKRDYVLARDKHACQARLSGCRERASQVHHLSYEHWGDEPLWELTSVCVPCHDRITEMDRARRGVAA